MELGAFSISLAVKDLEASKSFYEKLGFHVFGGDASQNWLILKNGDHTIGLFHGMFEKNILTFNPGWDNSPPDSGHALLSRLGRCRFPHWSRSPKQLGQMMVVIISTARSHRSACPREL